MKRLIVLIIVIIICFGLNITNPAREDFQVFINDVISKEFISNTDNGVLVNFISGVASSFVSKTAYNSTTRDNYYLFSIYTVNLMDEEYKFIGIFNTFIPLEE